MEHQILNLWEETDAFKQSLEKTKGKSPSFFTTDRRLPRVCRITAIWLRVRRGMCPVLIMKGATFAAFWLGLHGLPIEHEIDKQLGMSAQDAVAKLGVATTTKSAGPLCSAT